MPSVDLIARPHPTTTSGARLVEWRPSGDSASALAGRCTVTFSGGWTVSHIPIFRRDDGTLSPGVPSVPILGPDGTHARGDDGKRRYAPVISFENREARTRWNSAITGALNGAGIGGGAP